MITTRDSAKSSLGQEMHFVFFYDGKLLGLQFIHYANEASQNRFFLRPKLRK